MSGSEVAVERLCGGWEGGGGEGGGGEGGGGEGGGGEGDGGGVLVLVRCLTYGLRFRNQGG